MISFSKKMLKLFKDEFWKKRQITFSIILFKIIVRINIDNSMYIILELNTQFSTCSQSISQKI